MLDRHRCTNRYRVKQLSHVLVVQRYTTPSPIPLRAVAVNEDLSYAVSPLLENVAGNGLVLRLLCTDDLQHHHAV
jgi:hypothetical protein